MRKHWKILRDKIRAKMGIANLLSAFIAAGLGFLAANMADHDKIHWLSKQRPALIFSTLLLIIALILYLTTMCSYGTPLMPIRFWGENPSQADVRPPWIVKRPPSSASWILYQNMDLSVKLNGTNPISGIACNHRRTGVRVPKRCNHPIILPYSRVKAGP